MDSKNFKRMTTDSNQTITEGPIEQKQASLPKCARCGLKPLPLMMHEVNTPRGIVLGLVCCANCGHVHHVLVIGMQEAQLVDAKGHGIAPMVRQ